MDIICLSHGETQQQHLVMMKGYSDRGKSIAAKRHVDPLVTDVKNVVDFLHGMYKQGCRYRYSGICAARSALSSAVTIPGYERTSNHPLIS